MYLIKPIAHSNPVHGDITGPLGDLTLQDGGVSAGLRPKSDCSGKTQKQLYSKLQTRPLVREGATK
jgi:hypothetical protein